MKVAQLLCSRVSEKTLTSVGTMQRSGSPEDQKSVVITQRSVWSWSNVLHTVWPNPQCVFVHALV